MPLYVHFSCGLPWGWICVSTLKIQRITISDIVNKVRRNILACHSDGKRNESLCYVAGFNSYNLNWRTSKDSSISACGGALTNKIVSHYLTTVYMMEPRAEVHLYSLDTWTHISPFHSVDSTSIPKIWSWPHPLPSLLVFLCLCSDGIQFQTVSRCWLLAAVTLLSRGQRTCH